MRFMRRSSHCLSSSLVVDGAKPTEMHLTAIKRIFRYLKGTIHMAQFLDIDVVSWSSKKHKRKDTAISTTRLKYIAHIRKLCSNPLDADSTLANQAHWISFTTSTKSMMKGKLLRLYFVETKIHRLADIFTKTLPRERFALYSTAWMFKQLSPETQKELQEKILWSKGRTVAESIAVKIDTTNRIQLQERLSEYI
ncbi:hypothetical protein Tco_0969386 [Tanacetum coccineum]